MEIYFVGMESSSVCCVLVKANSEAAFTLLWNSVRMILENHCARELGGTFCFYSVSEISKEEGL